MRLRSRALISTGAAIGSNATALVSVPIILDRLGLAEFGVWAIGTVVVAYTTTLLSGFAPTVQRLAALAAGAGDKDRLRRVFWTAVVVYVGIGTVAAVLGTVLAEPFVALFSFPVRLRPDAVEMVRILGVTAGVGLVLSSMFNFLQGLGRFAVAAVANVGQSALYVGIAAVWLTPRGGVVFLSEALLIGTVAALVVSLIALGDVICIGLPRLLRPHEIREVVKFAVVLQVVPVALLINNQSDRVVIGIVAPAATVAEFAIGAQVAMAMRTALASALSPLFTDFATAIGAGTDPEEIRERFVALQRFWATLVIGVSGLTCAALGAILNTWLERPTGAAALFGVLTIIAFGINLLSGPATSYLRAAGTPGLEARYSVWTIAFNVVFTIACGLTLGAVGVVIGTLVAYAVATGQFFLRLRRLMPWAIDELPYRCARAGLIAAPLCVFCFGASRWIAAQLRGPLGLLCCAALLGAMFGAFAIVSGLRTLAGEARGGPGAGGPAGRPQVVRSSTARAMRAVERVGVSPDPGTCPCPRSNSISGEDKGPENLPAYDQLGAARANHAK